jgi:hypothetical protein
MGQTGFHLCMLLSVAAIRHNLFFDKKRRLTYSWQKDPFVLTFIRTITEMGYVRRLGIYFGITD